ncbi:MAG: hypothetical protein AW07_01310 [Candidatus Accumulibacter sp. SK-11]|nr:MAG: hypothetical protein AW07_01310 [Candidatus Accumulibacter sp. SK-11]
MLVDAVAAAVLIVVGGPDRDVVAVAEVGQGRLLLVGPLMVGGRIVDLAIAVHRIAGSVVLAHIHVGIGALGTPVVVVEADHEPTRGQADDVRLVLATSRVFVGPERAAHGGAAGVVALAHHRRAAAVLVVVAPDDDIATVVQGRHLGFVLGATGVAGIHQETVAEARGGRVEAAGVDAMAAAVIAVVVAPNHEQIAVRKSGDVRHELVTGLGRTTARARADQQLATDLVAGVVPALQGDVVVTTVSRTVGTPDRGEATAIGGQCVVVLGTVDVGIDQELAALGDAAGIVALSEHAPAGAVMTIGVLPGDDEAAVGQARHVGIALLTPGQAVDLPFRSHRHAAGVEALGVDAPGTAILTVGIPHHHITAITEMADFGTGLITRRVGVELLLAIGLGGAVELRSDVDGKHVGRAAAAVAVGHAQTQGAAGVGAGIGVGIAQALDQRFHRVGGGGVAGEVDAQVGAVAAAGNRADGGAAITHGSAGDADLAGGVTLVHDAELVFGGLASEVVEVETAAVEVGRIAVDQIRRRVDDLQTGVDGALVEADGAGEVGEFRVGGTWQLGGVAEQLLVDAAVAAILIVGTPDNDIVALTEVGHGRLVLVVAGVGVDQAVAIDRVAGGVILTDVDVGAGAVRAVVVIEEADHEATTGQADDVGFVLAARGVFVDADGGADFRVVSAVALGHHRRAAAVLVVFAPDDHIAAVAEGGHLGFVLGVVGARVHQEAVAEGAGADVEAAGVDAMAAAIVTVVVAPDDQQVAVVEGGDVGHELMSALRLRRVTGGRAHQKLRAVQRRAVVVEAAQIDIVIAAIGRIVGTPDGSEAAGIGAHRVVVLVVAGVARQGELTALGNAIHVITLAEHAPARSVIAGVVLPGDDEATVRQACHMGIVLAGTGEGRHAEFGAYGDAAGVVALGIDAVGIANAVLAARGPHHHVTAIGQAGNFRVVLVVVAVGVDLLLAVGGRGAIQLAGNVDADDAAEGGPAVAVADADAHFTRGRRVAAAVAVAQALDELLDGIDARVGVEVDDQAGAVCAIADAADRADGGAAIAHGAAGYADAAGSSAFVHHAQLIFGHGAGLDVIELDAAAVEIGGVSVSEAHRRIQDLEAGVDRVFGKSDAAGKITQHRVALAAEIRRVAENLLIDAKAGTRVLGLTGPGHDVVALPKVRHHRRILAIAAAIEGVDLLLTGDWGTGGIVFAGVDLVVLGLGRHVVAVPGDDEATGGQAGDVGVALIVVGGHVDAEFAAGGIAEGVVALAVDAVIAAVLAARLPDDDKAAIGQGRHARRELVVGFVGVDVKLAADLGAAAVIALGVDAGIAIAFLAFGTPDHHIAAIGIGGDVRLPLMVGGVGVDLELALAAGLQEVAGVVETAAEYAVAAGIHVVRVAGPSDDEAAVVGGHAGLVLGTGSGGVDQELAALGHAGSVEALRENAITAAVGAVVVAPDDDKATVGQGSDAGIGLGAAGGGVHPELGTNGYAVGIHPLSKNSFATAILSLRDPGGHVASARERRHGRG